RLFRMTASVAFGSAVGYLPMSAGAVRPSSAGVSVALLPSNRPVPTLTSRRRAGWFGSLRMSATSQNRTAVFVNRCVVGSVATAQFLSRMKNTLGALAEIVVLQFADGPVLILVSPVACVPTTYACR